MTGHSSLSEIKHLQWCDGDVEEFSNSSSQQLISTYTALPGKVPTQKVLQHHWVLSRQLIKNKV